MKYPGAPTPFAGLLTAAILCATSIASATTVTTDVVGFMKFPANDSADLRMGIPMHQSVTFSGSVESVSGGDITIGTTVPDVTSVPHYILVTSDNGLQGEWFQVTSASGTTVSVAEDLAAAGLTDADIIDIIPFWTLDSLFPEGGDMPASSNVIDPVAFVFLNDPTSVGTNISAADAYIYHSGEQLTAGWYDVNNLGGGSAGDTIISPESFITIRNLSGSDTSVLVAGTVPESPLSTSVVSRSEGTQDNLVFNPYPHEISLGNAGLVVSGAVTPSPNVIDPIDLLFVYDIDSDTVNGVASATYIYHSGEQLTAGWYDVNNLGGGSKDADTIPAGGAIVIRKASGNDTIISWTPNLPYEL